MQAQQLILFPEPAPPKPSSIIIRQPIVKPYEPHEIRTFWKNDHTGTCQQREGATLWPSTSLWIQITEQEYNRWVFNRRMMWTWPKEEQIKAQDETVVIIGV